MCIIIVVLHEILAHMSVSATPQDVFKQVRNAHLSRKRSSFWLQASVRQRLVVLLQKLELIDK